MGGVSTTKYFATRLATGTYFFCLGFFVARVRIESIEHKPIIGDEERYIKE